MRIMPMAFLLCLASTVANAQLSQDSKHVICSDTYKLIKDIVEIYNEKPVWTAKDSSNKSRYSLFVNDKTGSWTLLQMTPEIACVLGVGEESKFIFENSI